MQASRSHVVVALGERDGALRRDLERSDRSGDLDVVAVGPRPPRQARLGHARRDALDVGDRRPDRADRRRHAEVMVELRATTYAAPAAGSSGGRRREMTCETPSSPIETPYSVSAASIVRFWWVTTMNCARSA